jgi:hypothetical protein
MNGHRNALDTYYYKKKLEHFIIRNGAIIGKGEVYHNIDLRIIQYGKRSLSWRVANFSSFASSERHMPPMGTTYIFSFPLPSSFSKRNHLTAMHRCASCSPKRRPMLLTRHAAPAPPARIPTPPLLRLALLLRCLPAARPF